MQVFVVFDPPCSPITGCLECCFVIVSSLVCASAVLSLYMDQAGIAVQVPAANCGDHHEQQRNLWG